MYYFFFSSRRRHTRCSRDWSSDVCSSDLSSLAEMGAVILPPMPAFYARPKDIDDVVNHTIARVLDRLGLPQTLVAEWRGPNPPGPGAPRALPPPRPPPLPPGGEPPPALGGGSGGARRGRGPRRG